MSQSDILIVAAEASSCMYAIRFMKEWKKIYPDHNFFGIGDKKMEAFGMDCQGFAEKLAVVGLQEVIKHWGDIKKSFNDILDRCEKTPPKFALLLDYPGFNLRLAKKLKEQGVQVVYYISPQLWAWKKGRVKQVKAYVDDMLVVFPFEVDFYKDYQIESKFVGHPLVEVVDEEAKEFHTQNERKVLGLMPGSRNSEIQHNFLVQLQAAQKLKENNDIDIKVLVAPTLKTKDLQTLAGALGDGVEFIKGAPTEMIQKCDLILTASGTATLQVALCQKPMVVMYRMNAVTAFLAKLLVRSVDAFCIVNLIAKRKIVPEFFQNDANPERLSLELNEILNNKERHSQMMDDLKGVRSLLGEGHATNNVVHYLKEKYGDL